MDYLQIYKGIKIMHLTIFTILILMILIFGRLHSTVSLSSHANWVNTLNTPAPGYLAVDMKTPVAVEVSETLMESVDSPSSRANSLPVSTFCELFAFLLITVLFPDILKFSLNMFSHVDPDSICSHGRNRM